VTGVPAASIRAQVRLPVQLPGGIRTTARVYTFDGLVDGGQHVALALGDLSLTDLAGASPRGGVSGPAPLARLHSECLTGDLFGSRRCDCGPQLQEAVALMTRVGGVLLYLRQEGRGIGLYAKLDAYLLQDLGLDTYEANVALGYGPDQRDYTAAAQMLLALGLSRVALLSNNPDKADQLTRLGVVVCERVPTGVHVSDSNVRYLTTKARRGSHTLDLEQLIAEEPAGPGGGRSPTTLPTPPARGAARHTPGPVRPAPAPARTPRRPTP
jgi:GTP cyclohydrolase II